MASDESNIDATTTDRDSSGGIPPTAKETAAISATTSQKYISLQRNHSLSSARSTPCKSSNNSSNNGSRGRATTTTTTFPSSPALSTLSKNTFSSSGSSSSHARVNVDDILSNTKFKGRKKRSRASIDASMRKIMGDNNHKPSDSLVNTANKKPMKVHSSNDFVRQKTSAQKSLLVVEKTKSSQDVLGQEERKKRLERMQQEQLQRRLEMEQNNSKKGSIIKQQSSLDRVEKIQNGLTKSDTQDVSLKLGREAVADDDNMTTSSRGSSGSSKQKRSLQQKEVPAEKSPSDESPTSTSTRRSKRAKTIASYNVTDLAKNNIISNEINIDKSSVQTEKEGAPLTTKTMDQQKSVDTNTERQLLDEEAMIEEQQETEEPDSIHSALSTLLVKYNSCIKGGGYETTTPSKGTTASPWNVVQLLVAVLRYINLLDPESFNSSEYKEVEHGLANVLKSVERVKWQVMNRNTSNSNTNEQGGEDGELVTRKEARLLQMIQIQVWMRMMVWSLEDEHGWEFVKRVTALSNAKEMDGTDNTKSKGKGSKKKKKSKKKNKSHDKQPNASPRDSLVEDVRLLMELAPYVLPPSLDFAQWLKDTLTLGFRQPIPDYGTELFDHFEIELAESIALKRSGTDTSRRSELSEVSHSPLKGNAARKNNLSITTSASPKKKVSDKRNKRQQAYFASLATEEEKASSSNSNAAPDDETATITGSLSTVTSTSKASSMREKDDTILLKTSVSLTATVPAKKSNPFLKDSARGSYVGSHFSSNLSNISTLFREVKVPTKPKQAPKPSKAPQPKQPSKNKRNISSSLPRQLNVKDSAAATSTAEPEAVPAKQKRKFTITSNAKTRLSSSSLPTETPCKRLRPAFSSSRTTGTASFNSVKETPLRPIIEETPAKKNPATQHLRFRDGVNSIVEETPQPQQQQSLLRGRGFTSSSVLPTNLWSQSGRRPPQPRAFISSRSAQGRRQEKRNLTNSILSGNEHLSPVVDHQQFTPATLSFGLSPMPHQEEDMACVMAKAAKSAASRKRK